MNTEANITMNSNIDEQTMPEDSAERLTHAIYGLQLATFITVITFFIAVIINYIKRKDVQGTLYEKHFKWQMRTFWVWLLIVGTGVTLMLLTLGWIAFISPANDAHFLAIIVILPLTAVISAVYLIYRVARGWLRLNENQPPPGDND